MPKLPSLNVDLEIFKRQTLAWLRGASGVQTFSAAGTLDFTPRVIVDTSAGAVTVTLPRLSEVDIDQEYRVVNIGPNSVTINAGGTDTINGAGSYTLDGQYNGVHILTDGAKWYAF